MNMEPELKAMSDVYQVLKDLKPEAQQRIINWVLEKFSLSTVSSSQIPTQKSFTQEQIMEMGFESFNTLADVFVKITPANDPEKVLIAASYLQSKSDSDLTGREINKELNHLGHGVGNITNAISSLINRNPRLMIQTRKEGKTKQAQKKYKVTVEGINAAKKMFQEVGE